MSTLKELLTRYHKESVSIMIKMTRASAGKVCKRKKMTRKLNRVFPRGKSYIRIITCEINKGNKLVEP